MAKAKTQIRDFAKEAKAINAMKKEVFALDYNKLSKTDLIESKTPAKGGKLMILIPDPKGRAICLIDLGEKGFAVECLKRGTQFIFKKEESAKKALAQAITNSQNTLVLNFTDAE